MTAAQRRFLRFCLVGGTGFVADAALLYGLLSLTALDAFLARLLSFAGAVTLTWALNRRVTFADRRSDAWLAELGRYVLAQSLGAAINYGIYSAILLVRGADRGTAMVALAIASAVALALNFALAQRLVFQRR